MPIDKCAIQGQWRPACVAFVPATKDNTRFQGRDLHGTLHLEYR